MLYHLTLILGHQWDKVSNLTCYICNRKSLFFLFFITGGGIRHGSSWVYVTSQHPHQLCHYYLSSNVKKSGSRRFGKQRKGLNLSWLQAQHFLLHYTTLTLTLCSFFFFKAFLDLKIIQLFYKYILTVKLQIHIVKLKSVNRHIASHLY